MPDFDRVSSLLWVVRTTSVATVQQQSHITFVWTTTMRAWALYMRVCAVCAIIQYVCVWVLAGLSICALGLHVSASLC